LLIFQDHTHANTHTDKNTLVRAPSNEWQVRRSGRNQHNTQQTKSRKFYALIGAQTRDPTNETDADLHLKPSAIGSGLAA